jgi:hypothetical protein
MSTAKSIRWEIPHTVLILASKGSGKSTLIANFLTNPELYLKKYARVFIFSPTFKGDPSYAGITLPESQIFNTVEDPDIQGIVDMKMSPEYENENFLIVFDDIVSDRNIKKSAILKELILNSRHYGEVDEEGIQHGFTLVFSTQHLTSIPPYVRQNMNIVITFKTNNNGALKILWSEFGASFNYKQFIKIFNFATSEKYHFLMTDGIDYFKDFQLMSIKRNPE